MHLISHTHNIYVALQAGIFLSLKDILQIAKADNNNKRKFLLFLILSYPQPLLIKKYVLVPAHFLNWTG